MSDHSLEKRMQAFDLDSTLSLNTEALFENKSDKIKELSLESIEVGPQVRKTFIESELLELAQSIQDHGLMQPITVYPIEHNKYHLVCGEKRYRACKIADLEKITAYIINPPKDNLELIAMQIIENLHRSNPPVFEIAEAIGKMHESGLEIPQIVEMISSNKTYVYDMLRFNALSVEEKEAFKDYPKIFLLRFCSFKELNPELAQRIVQLTRYQDKENIYRLLNKWTDEPPKPKKENTVSKIKLNLKFSELDKIEPNLSSRYKAYFDQNPKETERSFVAKALAFYLNALAQDQNKEDLNDQATGHDTGSDS